MNTMPKMHQRLPPSGPEREALREKGQFWTPSWVADAMVAYVLAGNSDHIFDPAVGAGAFFLAAKRLSAQRGKPVSLLGVELDGRALEEAKNAGLSDWDLQSIEIRDFVLDPPRRNYSAIVANPPYIRHHRLSNELKQHLKLLCRQLIGRELDGRAGYHIYFFLRALQLLQGEGRLCFIMPADTCEGVFARNLWKWILAHYRLDAVVTFAPDATPFPSVDTNAIIFMIRHGTPTESFVWCRCVEPESSALHQFVGSDFEVSVPGIAAHRRTVAEALETGLSRAPAINVQKGPFLGDFATVLRGIATGANDFFFLTQVQATSLGIRHEWLVPAIGRTRDINGDRITRDDLQRLEGSGRPTLLLSLDGRPLEDFPDSIQQYIKAGENSGVNKRVLLASRRPWYKMEVREVPPFLFAYLGRRSARFIKNQAGVVPLTGFLCVYPKKRDPLYIEQLWIVLSHQDTVSSLQLVGKSYGAGAIKVEPRALERLPISGAALAEAGLAPEGALQAGLFS